MTDPKLDEKRFWRRLGILYDAWKGNKHDSLSKTDAIVLPFGNSGENNYSRIASLHIWLFGYELPDIVTIFTKDGIYFLGSKKKAEFLEAIESSEAKGSIPPITLLTRDKADKDAANFEKLVQIVKKYGKRVGELAKEKLDSDFTKLWRQALADGGVSEFVDITTGLALILAVKDDEEIECVRQACNITTTVWNKVLRKKILDIVDNSTKTRHDALAKITEDSLSDRKVVTGVNTQLVESCYLPIIQSGKNISMKLSAESDKENMTYSAMACSYGGRYQNYCSNVARTMMLEPTPAVEEAYQLLMDAEEAVFAALVPGASLASVYAAGLKVVQEKKPELVDKLTKSFGFITGIAFREASLLIGPKTMEKVEAGMTFVIHMGFSDISNTAGKSSNDKAIGLIDGACECLTEAARRKVKAMAIKFEVDENEVKEEDVSERRGVNESYGRTKRSVVLQDQTRSKLTNEEKRRDNQKRLGDALNEKAKERLASATQVDSAVKVKKSNVSYKNVAQMPNKDEIKALQIYVDTQAETVIVPIFGVTVPFHISMVKNVSTSLEGDGDFTYLRINLAHPTSSINSKDALAFPDPRATFVKELTYRASNAKEPGELHAPSSNLNTAYRLIKEIQKRYRTREAEEREKEGTVKQDKLVLSTNKTNPRLKELYMRPNIVSKRVSGTLEAHTNGFRYTSLRGDKVDVLFNNIKHAFYQSCNSEMIVLLHFHLKQPVLFGKKKQSDVQFYTEVGEVTTDLGKLNHMQDRDDVYLEQAEREMRNKLNAAFKSFCEKVERASGNQVEFDAPFRDLGFYGVPHRSSVLLQPTSGCLVSLVEWPPFVITLEEVETVHFERVSFSLKNFDAVFIFKQYARKTEMIQQIPMESLDGIKEWLNSCDIHYTEGLQSLNWPKIMKTINDDPDAFFADGGWTFLNPESDNEDEADSESSEDAYVPSDEEDEAGSDEDEENSESEEYEDDEDASASDDEDGSGDEEDDDESGKSWSDLEEEAKRADRDRGEFNDDMNRKGAGGGGASNKRQHSSPAKAHGRGAPPPKRRK